MITNLELYNGLARAKVVYGLHEVHIQLVAKQMGVVAADVAEYILANPTLVTTRVVAAGMGSPSNIMGEEYTGTYLSAVTLLPYLTTISTIYEGASGGTIVVTLTGATFETASGTGTNWTVDVGATGLTFASVAKNSASQCTLTFTGTAKVGDISIIAKNAAITANVDSAEMLFSTSPAVLDYATVNSLINRVTVLEDSVSSVGDVVVPVAEEGSIELAAGISLDFTNKVAGDNGLQINLIDPGADTADEIVEVDGNVINVTLAYNTGAITSTAAQVKAAIEADTAANAMVSVSIIGLNGNSTLAVDDSVTLSGGVNGTVAKAGKVLIGATKVAVATADCTAAVGHWEFVDYNAE